MNARALRALWPQNLLEYIHQRRWRCHVRAVARVKVVTRPTLVPRTFRELSERLRVPLLGKLETVRRAEADCEGELRANAILQRRDYPFVLYPERILRPFCEQFLAEDAVAGHR